MQSDIRFLPQLEHTDCESSSRLNLQPDVLVIVFTPTVEAFGLLFISENKTTPANTIKTVSSLDIFVNHPVMLINGSIGDGGVNRNPFHTDSCFTKDVFKFVGVVGFDGSKTGRETDRLRKGAPHNSHIVTIPLKTMFYHPRNRPEDFVFFGSVNENFPHPGINGP
jgi:hypothetical protein